MKFLINSALCFGLLFSNASAALKFDKEMVTVTIIHKISGFINWPRPFAEQFILCVANDHPQLATIKKYFDAVTMADKPVLVQVVRRQDSLSQCQLMFLADKDMADLPRYRSAADKDNILLVAEGSVAKNGIHVAFYFDMSKVRLEVNRKALEASGLKASFRLLEVAKIVD